MHQHFSSASIMKGKKRGQSSVELLVLFSVGLAIVLIIITANQQTFFSLNSQYDSEKARAVVNDIADAAERVYSQGVGAKTRIYVSIPPLVNEINISGNVVDIELLSGDSHRNIYRTFNFNVEGNLTKEEGNYWVLVESKNGYVSVLRALAIYLCGNAFKGSGEDCDTSDLGGNSCLSLGYYGGALSCTLSCTYNVSDCAPVGYFVWLLNTEAKFDSGSFINTYTNGNDVELNPGQAVGYYANVNDSGYTSVVWSNISFGEPLPYMEELPNYGESDYGADMGGNVLLMHLNEQSGAISDFSGNSNTGIVSGADYGLAGKFKSALKFSGYNYVDAGNSASLGIMDDLTIEAWIKPNGSIRKGTIYNRTLSTFEYDTGNGNEPSIISTGNGIYAIAYRGNLSDGFIATINISSDGQIANSVTDLLEYDASDGYEPAIINVGTGIYAIAYRGQGDDGFIATINISSDGQIANSVTDLFEYDTGNGYNPSIISTGNGIYAIAYRSNASDGFITTINISSDGDIKNGAIHSMEYDTTAGNTPQIFHVSNNIYAVAYRGAGSDGFIKTLEISSGSISGVISSFEYDSANGYEPSVLELSQSKYAVVHKGTGSDGFISTFEIISDKGIFKQGSYGIDANSTNAFATVNNDTITASLPSSSTGWIHIAMTYDKDSSPSQKLYVNGLPKNNATISFQISSNSNNFTIGKFFNGTIDEVAVYNRVLADSEILNHYKRGILNLSIMYRTCDDINCNGDAWLSSISNSTLKIINATNRFFQINATLSSDDSGYSPELNNVSVSYHTQ